MGRFRSRLLLAAALALLAALLAAQGALAAPLSPRIKAKVRVESSAYAVAPPTSVVFDWTRTFYDTAGNPYRPGHPSALGALAAAAKARGFTWEAGYGGNFIMQIGGFSSLPDFSQGWVYAVNGVGFPIVDMGTLDFRLEPGDTVLYAQYPDPTYSVGTKALVVRVDQSDRAYETGQPVVVTVLGDDLAKVNSATEATRYSVDATAVETPAQFAPVAGATVHVGSATVTTDATGKATLAGLASGTYRIWAEHEMDGAFAYVRSTPKAVNVADPLALSGLAVTPDPFTPGQTVRVAFTVSRAASVKYTVRTTSGVLIASLTRRVAGGPVTLRWSGDNAAGRPVRAGSYRVRVTATDTWGRSATPLATTITTR